MKVTICNEVYAVKDGTYLALIESVLPYGDNAGVVMKLKLDGKNEKDEQVFVKFLRAEELGTYPWSDIFRSINSTETDDLVGLRCEIEVKNNVSKTTGFEFCNIKRVRVISK